VRRIICTDVEQFLGLDLAVLTVVAVFSLRLQAVGSYCRDNSPSVFYDPGFDTKKLRSLT
jgi:hypothetical protein